MRNRIIGLAAALFMSLGLMAALPAAPAHAAYDTNYQNWCFKPGGVSKICIVAVWKRQDDGTGQRTKAFKFRWENKSAQTGWPYIKDMFVGGQNIAEPGQDWFGRSSAGQMDDDEWVHQLSGAATKTYEDSQRMTFNATLVRKGPLPDYHVRAKLTYGYDSENPRMWWKCTNTIGQDCKN